MILKNINLKFKIKYISQQECWCH